MVEAAPVNLPEVDTDAPYTLVKVKVPTRLGFLRTSALKIGEYKFPGDLRRSFHSATERRKITAGIIEVEFVDPVTKVSAGMHERGTTVREHMGASASHIEVVEPKKTAPENIEVPVHTTTTKIDIVDGHAKADTAPPELEVLKLRGNVKATSLLQKLEIGQSGTHKEWTITRQEGQLKLDQGDVEAGYVADEHLGDYTVAKLIEAIQDAETVNPEAATEVSGEAAAESAPLVESLTEEVVDAGSDTGPEGAELLDRAAAGAEDNAPDAGGTEPAAAADVPHGSVAHHDELGAEASAGNAVTNAPAPFDVVAEPSSPADGTEPHLEDGVGPLEVAAIAAERAAMGRSGHGGDTPPVEDEADESADAGEEPSDSDEDVFQPRDRSRSE